MLSVSLSTALDIACTLEEEGVQFYKNAAESSYFADKPDLKNMFMMFGRMEKRHLEQFTKLAMITEQNVKKKYEYPLSENNSDYLRAVMKDLCIIPENSKPDFSSFKTPADIICHAIKTEKQSVLFYTGLRQVFPDDIDASVIDEIITEETSHVAVMFREYEMLVG